MVLYNVTVILDETVESEWLGWMQSEHMPAIMATDAFISNRMLKVLDSPNEGVTYCLQFVAETEDNFRKYQAQHERGFTLALNEKFPNKFVSFSTLMEFIDHQ